MTGRMSGLSLFVATCVIGLATVNAGFAQIDFADPQVILAGTSRPSGTFVGDIDGDGDPDLVHVSGSMSDAVINLYLNDGAGVFSGPSFIPISAYGGHEVAGGDFDGDGDIDLAYTLFQPIAPLTESAQFILNNGDGTFSSPQGLVVSYNPLHIRAVDLDDDDDVDIVLTVANTDGLQTYLNDGSAHFTLQSNLGGSHGASDFEVGDLDGDGDLDVALASRNNQQVVVYSGDGAGGLILGISYGVGAYANGITLIDLEEDGDLDIVTAAEQRQQVLGLVNDGTGSFTETTIIDLTVPAGDVVGADFDGDGHVDLLVYANDTQTIYQGNGTGAFSSSLQLDSGTRGVFPSFADLNDDGKLDIVLANDVWDPSTQGDPSVRIFLNQTPPAPQEMTLQLPGGATMEFVWIEPGTFMMGTTEEQEQLLQGMGLWESAFENEQPAHNVTISKGLYVGKYEITQSQWLSVMGTTPWVPLVDFQPDNPAVWISWNDVQAFMGQVNGAASGETFRLPTEAEWEYACRAGTNTLWSFGDDSSLLGDYAWYNDNAWGAGLGYTGTVGAKLPNPWGLYDMHGNALEFVQDWYGLYSGEDQVDPVGPATGVNIVARGGYFPNLPRHTRSAHRYYVGFDRTNKSQDVGARLVLRIAEVDLILPDTTSFYDRALDVPIHIGETNGTGIVSAEVFVSYDSDLLTPRGTPASITTLTSGWSLEYNVEEGEGTSTDVLKVAMATDEQVLSGTGDLVVLHFDVADRRSPASSPLVFEHALLNDGSPGAVSQDGSMTLVGTDGTITSLPSEILPRWSIGVSVYDIDEDRDTGTPDAFAVAVANGSQTETLEVTETGISTGIFSGVVGTEFSLSPTSDDGIVQAKAGDQIVFSYADSLDSNGDTQTRTDITDVLGGTDGLIRATVVSQPGDTVRVRVSDADLSDAIAVSVANPRTGETESILLSQFTSGESHFYGRFFTDSQAGAVGDSTLEVAKGDILNITYADTLTANGGTAAVVDDDEVVDPFGDAHPNGSVQAFDAAQVLIHRLSTYGGGAGTLSGLDSLSANVDQGAPFGIIDGYDASLILRKVVGLIGRFEVQEPDAVNHPQPETELRPKPVPGERVLALMPGEGYLSVWMEDREEIVSGDLTLAGVRGQVVMGEELQAFLSVSQATEDGLQVVFAGAEAVSGPGELLRIAGVGPGDARLTRVSFNGGQIGARWGEGTASVAVPASFVLYPNVPNPFNPETVIRFALAQESVVRLEVFDVVGQRVLVLVGEQQPAGTHQVLWDGREETGERVSSGVYFCRLQARHEGGEFSQVRRMLLLK